MAKKSKSAKKPAKKFKPRFERIAAVEPRVPETAEKFPVIETTAEKFPAKTLYRCIAENSCTVKTLEYGRRFGPGQIVDLDELIPNGSELRRYVKLTCFAPIRAGG